MAPRASVPHPEQRHDERLRPGPWGWLLTLGLAVSVGAVFIPVDPRLALVVGVVVLAVLVAVLAVRAPRVAVVDGELVAGGAHVPLALLGAARPLDAAGVRHEMGPALDARAHVCLRGWVPTAVRVELEDPADPTPYWVVSTRHPESLLAALGAGR